jgi:hypothetical protein
MRMGLAGSIVRMGRGEKRRQIVVGKSEGKRPHGRSRRRCEKNIKSDLKEIGRDSG